MRAGSRSSVVVETWRALSPEQRVAGIGSLLLIVSTFGPFSFVEAAIVLVAAAVLLLLRKRAEGRQFHLPFGDGTVIAAAGLWSGLLIAIRLLDRSLGQNLLALACAAIVFAAGVRERAKRPADDFAGGGRDATGGAPDDWLAAEAETRRPPETAATQRLPGERAAERVHEGGAGSAAAEAPTRPLAGGHRGGPRSDDDATRPLPQDPPEMRTPGDRRDPRRGRDPRRDDRRRGPRG